MDPRTRLLDAAEDLFYGRGVQAVGMDEIRAASGVSLRRLYQLFPSKSDLVDAYLERRDLRWRARLAAYTEARPPGPDRVLAVFDWLHDWFSEPGFRGCAFINSFGEFGDTDPAVAARARSHKQEFHAYLTTLLPTPAHADAIYLLAEGAITTAAITGSPTPAHQARRVAALLLTLPPDPTPPA